MAEFPATNWLGYSMNMVGTTPLDTNSAEKAVQTLHRIIEFDEDNTRPVEVDGVTYNVPKSIGVQMDDNVSIGFVTYPSGSDAAIAFRNDSTLAARFMSVTGDPSVGAATEKHHRRNVQYAYYCYSQSKYIAFLKNYANLLNKDSLLQGIRQLPTIFNGENEDVLNKYKDFFQRYGTHVIVKVGFGAHLQLHVWGSNSKSTVNSNWANDIKADYHGIPSGGQRDISVKSTAQYQDYLEFKQRIDSVYGGDGSLARSLITNPTYSAFKNWVETSNTKPALLSFVVAELWSLMKGSANEEISKFAPRIQEAFEWIVDRPKIYRTSVTLSVESDWAEFGLLTPSAVILKGNVVPEMTQCNEMKLTWGKERSHRYRRQQIQFYVVNDGYPIDFYFSHGSRAGPGSAKGTARVTVEGETYINDRITDGNYNTVWFYRAPVNATHESFVPAPREGTDNDDISMWDHVLEQYLNVVVSRVGVQD